MKKGAHRNEENIFIELQKRLPTYGNVDSHYVTNNNTVHRYEYAYCKQKSAENAYTAIFRSS